MTAGPGNSLRELTERAILQQIGSVGALVNGQGDILYLHGRTGMYLEPVPGETGTSNILKMAREGLRRDLTTTLRKAASTNESVRALNLHVKTNGHFTTVNLTIRPVAAGPAAPTESSLYLVMLEDALPVDPKQAHQAGLSTSAGADGTDTSTGLSAGEGADVHIAALKQNYAPGRIPSEHHRGT